MRRWLQFAALTVAVAFLYTNAWLLLSSAVVVLTDHARSLRELCSGVTALGIAWLVRRYVRIWPSALCCLAGALPVLYVWLSVRTQPSWETLTGYLRWGLLQSFVFAAAMLPAAYLAFRLRTSNHVLKGDVRA